jgi:hypothetical protein
MTMDQATPKSRKINWLRLVADGVGVALFAAAALWTYLASSRAGGEPEEVAGIIVLSGLGLGGAALVSRFSRTLVPAVIIGWAAVLAVTTPTLLDRGPLSGPFGYSNARGAFYLVAATAAVMLVARWRDVLVRIVAGVFLVVLAVVPVVTGAQAASILLALPLVAVVVGIKFPRAMIASLGVLFLGAVTATVLLAGLSPERLPDAVGERAEAALTERRVTLWDEAFDLMRSDPLYGVGPGRFREESPTALSDIDAHWAHNAFLQQGAETGVPGMVLLTGIFVWGFVRLLVTRDPDAGVAVAAAGLAAVGIEACIDYILHFAAVPVVTAALVGTGFFGRKPRRDDEEESEERELAVAGA